MSCYQEHYDPNKPVCDNQADFNQAFQAGLKYVRKENMKKNQAWMWVSLVLFVIFFVWALSLAMKLNKGPERIEHLLFAMLFSPIYIIAHYLNQQK